MSGLWRVTLRHNFETAHRLSTPGAPRKCMSIHGHSWLAIVDIAGESLDEGGILVEFGAFKHAWRTWLDSHLDHALVLRRGDPMEAAVRGAYAESRLYLLDQDPTTEVLAKHLAEVTAGILATVRPPGVDAWVERMTLRETRVNEASWTAPARSATERRG